MTTEMEDKQARHSRYLSEILDSLGYSENIRKIVIKLRTTYDILHTVTMQLVRDLKRETYTFGSCSEGTTIGGILSDVDTLICDVSIPVVDRPTDGPPSGQCFLTVSETNTRTGYTKLQDVNDRKPSTDKRLEDDTSKRFTLDGDGRKMRNHYWDGEINKRPHERNGPAATVKLNGCRYDMVFAYRYRKWPVIAMEWKTRVRDYNWPSTEVINKCCSLGCFLIPKGDFQSSDVETEWRFSFALQERELMHSLNAVQFKCYVLLKYIIMEKFPSEPEESITSNHSKTCLFYAIELTAADFWTPDNLITCLLFCLRQLYRWLKDGCCPNYFIRKDNMFKRKLHGELLRKTTSILANLMEHKYQFIFDLKADVIGKRLSEMRSANAEDNMIPANQNGVLFHARSFLEDTLIGISILLESTLVNNELVPCTDAHLKLISKLETFPNTVTEHTKEQTTEAIDLILPIVYTSLASHEAAQLIQLTTVGHEKERIRLSMYNNIERGLQTCLTSCQLKLAEIHYKLGEYEAFEKILSAALLMFHKEARANVCRYSEWNVDMPCNDVCFDDQMVSGINSGTVPLSELLKSSFSTCPRFLRTEKAIHPSAMLYEIIVVPKDGSIDLDPGNNRAEVDFNAFECYMHYLVYDKLRTTNEKRSAVEQLIKDERIHDETLATKLQGCIRTQHAQETV